MSAHALAATNGGPRTEGHLHWPERLFGREAALATLLAAFDRTSVGPSEVLLVPGASGAGKTALVLQARAKVRDRNGFFLLGKFEQYRRHVPYFPLRQALSGLCAEIERDVPEQREAWRARLQDAVGSLGGVLTDLVPEFEDLLGRQPEVPEISPQEARHRFARVIRDLFAAVCRAEHPVLLCIDDWQWADAATLSLVGQLGLGESSRHLLLVASYRDNEVDASHPATVAFEELRRQGAEVGTLEVRNLRVEDVRALVEATLVPEVEDADGLAAVLHEQTRGNPFFLRAALGFLEESRSLRFEPIRGRWDWVGPTETRRTVPPDPVSLFSVRLRALDPALQDLLALAACLGTRFDETTLAVVSGRAEADCRRWLSEAASRGLVRPVITADAAGGPPGRARNHEFFHDRVQQAAYALIEPADMPRVRLRIGRVLLSQLPIEQLHARLFDVVEHFNAGGGLITELEERETVLALNVAATRRAQVATAFKSALSFVRAGASVLDHPVLGEEVWRTRRSLAIELLAERAKLEFLEGDRDVADRCIEDAVARAQSGVERADALATRIVHHTLLARYPEAIAAGREALAALGIDLPVGNFDAARDLEIKRVREALGGRPVASLADLPVMRDPTITSAVKILITMGPPCYRSHQRLWAVIVPKVVYLTLQHGHVPQVGYSHTAFGGLLAWVDHDYAMAREFGLLAARLMRETFQSPSDQSVFHLMIGSSARHWFAPLRESSEDYRKAYTVGAESGNLQYAAYAFGHDMYCRYYRGVPLPELLEESQRSLAFSRSRHNQWAIDLLEGGVRLFEELSSGGAGPGGDADWERAYQARVDGHQNIQVACIHRVLKSHALLVMGEHARALAISDEAAPLLYTVGTQGLLPWPEHVYARFLTISALCQNASASQRNKWRRELDEILGLLRTWANHAPENFEHRYLLACAELARLDHRSIEAAGLYSDAVASAEAEGYVQWEGLAHERASRFWSAQGSQWPAQVHWQQAYSCFHRWGAVAKVRAMEARLEHQLRSDLLRGSGQADGGHGGLNDSWTGAIVGRQLETLRSQATDRAGRHRQRQAVDRVEDLAAAAERLRMEVAQRRKVEDELRQHRELLEERVLDRVAELEASRRQLAEARAAALNLMEDAIAARDGAQREVLERARAEESVRRALADREVLLHEIHHRVKNNLQIVSGLLHLQVEAVTDPVAIASIRESQDRVMSIALVHEQLYQSTDLARLDFGAYVDRLTTHLLRANGARGRPVRLDLDVPPAPLDLNTAIPCGLIINELVTNALKHAFPADSPEAPVISVGWEDAGQQWRLRVEDNGAGASQGLDFTQPNTLGLGLVQMLVRQLRGTVRVEPGAGCRLIVDVPKR